MPMAVFRWDVVGTPRQFIGLCAEVMQANVISFYSGDVGYDYEDRIVDHCCGKKVSMKKCVKGCSALEGTAKMVTANEGKYGMASQGRV